MQPLVRSHIQPPGEVVDQRQHFIMFSTCLLRKTVRIQNSALNLRIISIIHKYIYIYDVITALIVC